MKITTKCHLKALSDTMELGLIAAVVGIGSGILALYADITWIAHDIKANGASDTYSIIQFLLKSGIWVAIVALGVTVLALINHHRTIYKTRLQEIYSDKVTKSIARRKRDKETRT